MLYCAFYYTHNFSNLINYLIWIVNDKCALGWSEKEEFSEKIRNPIGQSNISMELYVEIILIKFQTSRLLSSGFSMHIEIYKIIRNIRIVFILISIMHLFLE